MGASISTLSTFDQLTLSVTQSIQPLLSMGWRAGRDSLTSCLLQPQIIQEVDKGPTFEDLFDPSSDAESSSVLEDGPEYVNPDTIPLRRSIKSFCLPGLRSEWIREQIKQNEDRWLSEQERLDQFEEQIGSPPQDERSGLSSIISGDESPPGEILDPTRDIGYWLGDVFGQNSVWNSRFWNWLCTHFEIIKMHVELKEAGTLTESWQSCHDACYKLQSYLSRAHHTLCSARKTLESNMRRHKLPAQRRKWRTVAMASVKLSGPKATKKVHKASKDRYLFPKAWCKDNKIQVTTVSSIITGCEELRRLRGTIMRSRISKKLSLPGIQEISDDTPLEDAIYDLRFMLNLDPQPTVPRQKHLKDMKWFAHVVKANEAKMKQALMDTELIIWLLYPIVRQCKGKEEQLADAFKTTMPELEAVWWTQIESLHEAAKMLLQHPDEFALEEVRSLADEIMDCLQNAGHEEDASASLKQVEESRERIDSTTSGNDVSAT